MKSALPQVLRLIAILLLIGGVVLGGLDAYGMARAPVVLDETVGSRLPAVAEAVAIVFGLVGLAALLYGMAAILELGAGGGSDSGQVIAEFRQSMQRLRASVDQLADERRDSPAHHAPIYIHEPAPGDTVAGAALGTPEAAHQMIGLLEEIRELAMLSDAQRQQRVAEAQEHRRSNLLTEAQRLMELKDWGEADKAIARLASEFPQEKKLRELKDGLAAGRRDAEQNAIGELRERVENLMAVWAWDQAYAESARFVELFPDHPEGKELLGRVMQEREIYIESTANRLYEEIKTDIERRLWRRAMTNAIKLLECAPGHRRSVSIRGQLKAIRENAEIEERQEQERRIQELIRSKQFPDAIELGEDLLRRFPNSPQAETLQKLLPKMRELAIGNEVEAQAEAD